MRAYLFSGLTVALKPTDQVDPIARCVLVFLNVLYYTKRSLLMGAQLYVHKGGVQHDFCNAREPDAVRHIEGHCGRRGRALIAW